MSKSIVLTLATQAGLGQAQYVGPSSNQQMSVKE
ncbi:YgiW/YdeI family stress tolerance OB fold protein, partial [Bordetella pertussis]